jgi:hypothetical protein
MRLLTTVLCLAVLPLALGAAPGSPAKASHPGAAPFRWGRTGHRLIARVASEHLSPAAKREVRDLLGRETLASIASWGDEIRSERPETGNWHYVNIPVIDSVWRPTRFCAHGCVVAALDSQLVLLANRDNSRAVRAEALKWVVHLVGDIHMPLHAGDRGDRGGNDVAITWRGHRTNLHRLWDSELIDASGRSENAWVTLIGRQMDRRGDLAALASGTTVDWAMESHDVARDVVYPFVPRSLALDQHYYDQVHLVLEDRLLRASVRLTALLDRVLAGR